MCTQFLGLKKPRKECALDSHKYGNSIQKTSKRNSTHSHWLKMTENRSTCKVFIIMYLRACHSAIRTNKNFVTRLKKAAKLHNFGLPEHWILKHKQWHNFKSHILRLKKKSPPHRYYYVFWSLLNHLHRERTNGYWSHWQAFIIWYTSYYIMFFIIKSVKNIKSLLLLWYYIHTFYLLLFWNIIILTSWWMHI